MRKLVLTCRSMQAQLEQSIPKKTHQEIVAKMQATIDGLSADLERTKQELSKTTTIGEHLNSLSAKVSEQEERIANQTKIIEAFSQRFAESTVPASMYSEVVAKNKELTEKISCMVSREDYIALQNRFNELESKMASMVPKVEFESLQAKIATMVPKSDYDERSAALSSLQEQYRALETRAAALEAKLADSVPRSDFDELTARIAQLTMEATRFATELASVPSSVESPVATITQSNEVVNSSPAQGVTPTAEVLTSSSSQAPVEVQETVGPQLSEPSQVPSEVEANVVATTNAPETTSTAPNVQEASLVQANAETVQTQNQESQDIHQPTASVLESVAPPAATSTPEAVPVAAQATETAEPVVSQSTTTTVIAETLTAEAPASNQEEQALVASVADNQSTQESQKVESVQSEVVPEIASAPATPVQETASLELSTAPSISETKEEQQRQAEEEEEEERQQQPPEIREVQSQLSEIHTSAETGQTSFAPSVVVDPSRGFKFTNTDFYATSVIDFLQDLEKVPLETIEYHTRNGDFERWFADVITDAQCAESLKSIREASYGGEELRTKTIQVIAPKYRAN